MCPYIYGTKKRFWCINSIKYLNMMNLNSGESEHEFSIIKTKSRKNWCCVLNKCTCCITIHTMITFWTLEYWHFFIFLYRNTRVGPYSIDHHCCRFVFRFKSCSDICVQIFVFRSLSSDICVEIFVFRFLCSDICVQIFVFRFYNAYICSRKNWFCVLNECTCCITIHTMIRF